MHYDTELTNDRDVVPKDGDNTRLTATDNGAPGVVITDDTERYPIRSDDDLGVDRIGIKERNRNFGRKVVL